jgi:hypothetical protein
MSNVVEKNWKNGILTWIIFNKIWRENLLEKVHFEGIGQEESKEHRLCGREVDFSST